MLDRFLTARLIKAYPAGVKVAFPIDAAVTGGAADLRRRGAGGAGFLGERKLRPRLPGRVRVPRYCRGTRVTNVRRTSRAAIHLTTKFAASRSNQAIESERRIAIWRGKRRERGPWRKPRKRRCRRRIASSPPPKRY